MPMNFMVFIQGQQRIFQEKISETLHLIQSDGSMVAVAVLMLIGFIYGVLHAAGPGHGKLVISSYVLASKSTVKRAIIITFLAALMQSIVAIILVMSVFYFLNLTRSSAEHAANMLEAVGFTIVMLLGLRLVWRGMKMWQPTHHHECCNHTHMPEAEAIAGASSLREMALLVFSVGIRPCSGAIIMLYFASVIGLVWPGILAVLAMGLGTAFATSGFALLAIGSKHGLLSLFNLSEKMAHRVHALIAIIGGLLLIIVGGLFLYGFTIISTPAPHPLMRPL